MSLVEKLSVLVGNAFEAAGYESGLGAVVVSELPASQFQCNGALAGAKKHGISPREMAENVVSRLSGAVGLSSVSVAGPGFINISVTDQLLTAGLDFGDRLGIAPDPAPRRTFLDFGGPNVAKPMHVGHLRSSIIGDCLQRLYRFMGNDVVSENHLGDWGTQMGMIICGVQREQPDLLYFDASFTGSYPTEPPVTLEDLECIYPRESALCKEDEAERKHALRATVELQAGRPGYRALWQHFVDLSVVSLKKNFEWLDVKFDAWNGESHYNDQIPAVLEDLKKRRIAKESEGALVVFVDESVPPLLLLKSDGAYLYGTTDLTTIHDRVNQGAKRIVYVVDSRQDLHFRQVFAAARLSGIAPDSVDLDFLGFGTMNGPDGKPFKTRNGGAMRLDELMELVVGKARERMTEANLASDYPEAEREEIANAVGKAALKFADLINNRASDYVFDLDRFSAFEGKTGPYLIYTAVRIKSVFRKVGENDGVFATRLSDRERDLLLLAASLPEAIETAYDQSNPNVLCEQAFRLCQAFNRFYQDCNILRETDPVKRSSWLATCSLVLKQMELICTLIGITIPERM